MKIREIRVRDRGEDNVNRILNFVLKRHKEIKEDSPGLHCSP